MKPDQLRRRLTSLRDKTAGAESLPPSGYWIGDSAGQRRVHDDWASGRLNWKSAHNSAKRGLEALDAGDLEMAEVSAWDATDHFVAALEACITPSDIKNLTNPAGRRGRPRKIT